MKAWFFGLKPRERILVAAAAGIAGLAVFWVLVWEPLDEARERARTRIAAQQALLDWLERVAPEVERLRANDPDERSLGGRSPLSVVDRSARAAGLAGALKRIEPGAGDEIRVTFEAAAFADLMNWLQGLVAERPLAVERIDLARAGSGRVGGSVVLRRTDVAADRP